MSGRAVGGQDAPFVRNEASDARDQRRGGGGDGIIYFLSLMLFKYLPPLNPGIFSMNAVRTI